MDKIELTTILTGTSSEPFREAFEDGWKGATKNSVVRLATQGHARGSANDHLERVRRAAKKTVVSLETVEDLATRQQQRDEAYQGHEKAQDSQEEAIQTGMRFFGAATYHLDKAISQENEDVGRDELLRATTVYGKALGHAHRITDGDTQRRFLAYLEEASLSESLRGLAQEQINEGFHATR